MGHGEVVAINFMALTYILQLLYSIFLSTHQFKMIFCAVPKKLKYLFRREISIFDDRLLCDHLHYINNIFHTFKMV